MNKAIQMVDSFIDRETLGNSPETVVLQVRAFVLMLLAVITTMVVFLVSNLLQGYYLPFPAQGAVLASAIAFLFLLRRGISRRFIFNAALAVCVTYLMLMGYLTRDYVRMLPWWGTLLISATILTDNVRDTLVWTLIFFVCAMVSLGFGPEGIFHNGIQALVMVFFCVSVVQNYYVKSKNMLVHKLHEALGEIKTLQGMLPLCSHCRKIRDQDGRWDVIESYVTRHSEAEFTHSLCPECIQELYPGMSEKIQARQNAALRSEQDSGAKGSSREPRK